MKKIGRYTGVFVVSCITFLLCTTVSSLALQSPTDDLKPTLDTLVEHLQDPALKGDAKKDERRKIIMTTVKKGFDFREMSKRVLGKKTWKIISDSERDYFTKLITDLLENAYIGKLENYSGQKIKFTDEKIKNDPKRGLRAKVSTSIENEGGQFPIHYIMRPNSGKWMVYDIKLDSLSLVINYYKQFKPILKRHKFNGLVEKLEEMTNSFKLDPGK